MSASGPEMIGRYQVLRKIATGGMAELFLARQVGMGGFEKVVAIKRILGHLAHNEEFINMFRDEARIVAQLSHPNIVQIYDLGLADESYFIAMEYISGRNLSSVAKRAKAKARAMPPHYVARCVGQVCEGLHYAHTRQDMNGQPLGIVHRDVSPQNIICAFSGAVKLVDFGIAKAGSKIATTRAGVLKGKYAYMAPEQIRGRGVDARSDLFAVGIVLYELLCGRRPFEKPNSLETLKAIVQLEPVDCQKQNPDIPDRLADIIRRCLIKDPAARYQSAQEVQLELEDFVSDCGRVNNLTISEWVSDLFSEELSQDQGQTVMFPGLGRVVLPALNETTPEGEALEANIEVQTSGDRPSPLARSEASVQEPQSVSKPLESGQSWVQPDAWPASAWDEEDATVHMHALKADPTKSDGGFQEGVTECPSEPPKPDAAPDPVLSEPLLPEAHAEAQIDPQVESHPETPEAPGHPAEGFQASFLPVPHDDATLAAPMGIESLAVHEATTAWLPSQSELDEDDPWFDKTTADPPGVSPSDMEAPDPTAGEPLAPQVDDASTGADTEDPADAPSAPEAHTLRPFAATTPLSREPSSSLDSGDLGSQSERAPLIRADTDEQDEALPGADDREASEPPQASDAPSSAPTEEVTEGLTGPPSSPASPSPLARFAERTESVPGPKQAPLEEALAKPTPVILSALDEADTDGHLGFDAPRLAVKPLSKPRSKPSTGDIYPKPPRRLLNEQGPSEGRSWLLPVSLLMLLIIVIFGVFSWMQLRVQPGLTIITDPPGALVFINQQVQTQPTPIVLEGLEPGVIYEVELRYDGYEAIHRLVKLKADTPFVWKTTLNAESQQPGGGPGDPPKPRQP